jgi:hypothetical protein
VITILMALGCQGIDRKGDADSSPRRALMLGVSGRDGMLTGSAGSRETPRAKGWSPPSYTNPNGSPTPPSIATNEEGWALLRNDDLQSSSSGHP